MTGLIYCIGFRASGKSTYGAALGNRLGFPVYDLDDLIAARAGRPIDRLFVAEGEARFRQREQETLRSLLSSREGRQQSTVVILGAGFSLETLPTIIQPEDVVIWLTRPTDGQPRPLAGRPRLRPDLSEAEEWAQLFAERRPMYAAVATHIWRTGEDEPPAVAVDRLLLEIPRLMPAVRIRPADPVCWHGTISASKSELLRALVLAAQSDRPVTIDGHSRCDDVTVMCRALRLLGVRIEETADSFTIIPPRNGLGLPNDTVVHVDAGASAAACRFLMPLLAKVPGRFLLDGTPRLRARPLAPLVDAVRAMGGIVNYVELPGFAPLRIDGGGFGTVNAGLIHLDDVPSSQFASALLLSGAGLPFPPALKGEPIGSRPYLTLTVEMLRRCGIAATTGGLAPHSRVRAECIPVDADAGSASYLLAAGALGGEVIVDGYPSRPLQADRVFLEYLTAMGIRVRDHGATVSAHRGSIRPFSVDVRDCPDLAPLLAVLATFAEGKSRITGAPHLRQKESDRIEDLAIELSAVDVAVETLPDGLTVHGRGPGTIRIGAATSLNPHSDHRLAMSMALLAFHGFPVTIADPGVVTKSFPEFWLTLAASGCAIQPIYAR
ncbi:MAG: 3-phosphoshikimate 1-carboxyvinyltransferase [Deltaproteobacteria bacterium]|nr:3-phosphoshikimate 1-carboxyvinyltransferase [Deltaproteobacteria bacterium]